MVEGVDVPVLRLPSGESPANLSHRPVRSVLPDRREAADSTRGLVRSVLPGLREPGDTVPLMKSSSLSLNEDSSWVMPEVQTAQLSSCPSSKLLVPPTYGLAICVFAISIRFSVSIDLAICAFALSNVAGMVLTTSVRCMKALSSRRYGAALRWNLFEAPRSPTLPGGRSNAEADVVREIPTGLL